MKVKVKVDIETSSFSLIKDEWYEVLDTRVNSINTYYKIEHKKDSILAYQWFLSDKFYTLEEIRELKLETILK